MNLYNKIRKIGLLDKYTKNLIKNRKVWSIDDINIIIYKYTYLNDFIKKEKNAYLYIKRNKLEHLLNKLKRKNVVWDTDKIIDIKNIKNISQLKSMCPGCIKYVRKNNLVKKLFN